MALAGCCALAWLLLARAPAMRVIQLPPGTVEIDRPIEITGAYVEVRGAGTVLRAAAGFHGRALILCRHAHDVRFHDFAVDGNRAALEVRTGLPPSNLPFSAFTPHNGILVEDSRDVAVERVAFREMAGFAVLAARSRGVKVRDVRVADSGSRNPAGRNNATGGILLEEGCSGFEVTGCTLENLRGNGIWTHSLYRSPRNRGGLIARNRFRRIGRDAVQVGHATAVLVEGNQGTDIGFPAEEVDLEGGATPVGVDTAGNVDRSVYAANRFLNVNGKCIDLDGFHHGQVRDNLCVGLGGYAIVMYNSNPDMESEGIDIVDNEVRGARYGGVYVIGRGHTVRRNRLLDLNTARCGPCYYLPGEDDMLRSGIYLGRGIERPAFAAGNTVEDNRITGFGMAGHCVVAAPGVRLEANRVRGNRCADR